MVYGWVEHVEAVFPLAEFACGRSPGFGTAVSVVCVCCVGPFCSLEPLAMGLVGSGVSMGGILVQRVG